MQSGEDCLKASLTGYRVAANICMFRRVALWEVGFYRTDLAFAEDWDLAVRLADANWGNVYANEVLANYRVWDTTANARARRKMAELMGCTSVFEHSVVPAFTRRNWSLHPVVRARQRLAVAQAECLREPWLMDEERRALKQALCRLGDSKTLQWKFKWMGTSLESLMRIPARTGTSVKSLIKAVLYPPAH